MQLIDDWKTSYRKASVAIGGALSTVFGIMVYEPGLRQPVFDFVGVHDPVKIAFIGFVLVVVSRVIHFKKKPVDEA